MGLIDMFKVTIGAVFILVLLESIIPSEIAFWISVSIWIIAILSIAYADVKEFWNKIK